MLDLSPVADLAAGQAQLDGARALRLLCGDRQEGWALKDVGSGASKPWMLRDGAGGKTPRGWDRQDRSRLEMGDELDIR